MQKNRNTEKNQECCGLLGRSLKHSFSPEIHRRIGELTGRPYEYKLYEKEPEEVENFLRNGEWDGLNVTIPYKETVMAYCDELSEEARAIGAVNTLVRRDGKIVGYNTDYTGFRKSLEQNGVAVRGARTMVLGSGGASKAVCRVLEDMGAASVKLVSRSGKINYENLNRHKDAEILVNTTPVGMYPNTGQAAVFPGTFPNLKWAVDVIYNPLRTNFLCQAKKAGINYMSGLAMLVLQAVAAAEIFWDETISASVGRQIERELSVEKENIVLIGMPGVGKTTTGIALASEMGRPFYDIDEMIVSMAGKSIPEIFAEDGEDAFRQAESEAARELSKVTGAVIACGGGVVNREENYYTLAENGHIVFLNRDISLLPTDGRPVSQAVPPERLYRIRLPLYRSWCDDEIEITGNSPEETAAHIMDMLQGV